MIQRTEAVDCREEEAMGRRIEGMARILAVASGKGGVGKTTVSVNLALALAADGSRVGLFDADIYGPNVPLMLGVPEMRSAQVMLPVARAESTPYLRPLWRYGLHVMSIGLLVADSDAVMPDPRVAGMLVTQTINDVAWGELDYLLIDLPPGTGEPQHTLLQAVQVDGVVVVTTPQDLSLLDTGRSLQMFRKAHVPILGIIENMSYLVCPHCGERIDVFHQTNRRWIARDEDLPVLGHIPMDTTISRAIDAGHPLVGAAPATAGAAIFREIAWRVKQQLDQET